LIAIFEYADLTITLKTTTEPAFQDCLAIIGALHQDIKRLFPNWGKPKARMEVGLFCPKCHHENPPIGYLIGENKKCGLVANHSLLKSEKANPRIVAECYFLAYEVEKQWLTKDLEYARNLVKRRVKKNIEKTRELGTGNS